MTTIAPGAPYTARSSWAEYTGGPAADVTGLTIKIIRIADLAVIVAATSTGIVHLATGEYAYQWTPASDATGDFLIVWTTGAGRQASETVTVGVATGVSLDEVIEYIGIAALTPWVVLVDDVETYPQVADALATETAAQRRRCTYPTATEANPNPDVSDLLEALKRRVQRNLAMRPLPLSFQPSGIDGTPVRISYTDPEIRRLEGPFRKRTVG